MTCSTCKTTVYFDTDPIGRSLECCRCGSRFMRPPPPTHYGTPLPKGPRRRPCAYCGRHYRPKHDKDDSRYCCPNHRLRAYRLRQHETHTEVRVWISLPCAL